MSNIYICIMFNVTYAYKCLTGVILSVCMIYLSGGHPRGAPSVRGIVGQGRHSTDRSGADLRYPRGGHRLKRKIMNSLKTVNLKLVVAQHLFSI